METLTIKYTDDPTATEKTREEIRPGCPHISFSVKPYVRVSIDNPLPRSGLFSIQLNVSEGDTLKTLFEKAGRAIGLKG